MDNKSTFNKAEDFIEGQVLVFDKPLTWTSFDVVNKVRGTIRHAFNIRKIKVGHAGTLDPLATGVLVVCTGRKTKTINLLQAEQKTYTGIIRLGATTPSFDAETEVDNWGDEKEIKSLDEVKIKEAASRLTGDLDQIPPQYSAKKVDGVTAYKNARLGKHVELKPAQVTVNSFDIISLERKTISNKEVVDVGFMVVCSKGTYIRAMARDMGEILKVGGTLIELRRSKSGNFCVEDAWKLEEFIEAVKCLAITEKKD